MAINWLNSFGESSLGDKELNESFSPDRKIIDNSPSMFAGTWDALTYTIPNGIFSSLGAFSEFSAAKLSQLYDLNLDNNEDALSEPIKAGKDKIVARLENEAKYYRLKAKNDWTPNPETTGVAAQMIHGMGTTILKAVGYTAMAGGNPWFGGAMFGAEMGLNEFGTLKDKGVDAKTAEKAGWHSAGLNALGLVIPGSIGTSYLKSAALGAIVNPASDIAEQGAIKLILENADYEKISGEYDPFDPVNLSVSAGVGIAFGLLGAKGARTRARYAEQFAKEDAEKAEQVTKKEEGPRLNQEVLNSIQNRDRSSQQSVIQMRKIAENPDFNLISESRTLENGSPVIAFVDNPNPKTMGKEVVVSASDGRRMNMRYAVVEADSILTSNDVEGFKNPDFTNPEVFGARAIAGNGRVAGVKSAYRNGTAGKYREELMQQSKQFGISRRKIKNMKAPILVRIMNDEDVKPEVGELSNRSGIQKLDPVEQAAQDARNVDVENLEFNADGSFSQKSIQAFVKANPDKEGMVGQRGEVLADYASQRMRTAVFSAAYGDSSLVSRFIANSDKDRKVFTALLNVAPDIVKLRKLGGKFDFSNSVIEAVADVFETRKETKGLARGENTISLLPTSEEQEYFKKILLSKNPEKITDVIRRMREIASDETETGFFGEVTRAEVFNKVEEEFAGLDLSPDIEAAALRKGIDKKINSAHVDAAMELEMSNVMTKDQPVGRNGNINTSLKDEANAREQLDNGKKVEVSGEGVDPEVMDRNVGEFVTRFVRELVGAGADKKVAEMGARLHQAVWDTFGARLGVSPKELEAQYRLRVQRGETADGFAQEIFVKKGFVRKSDDDLAQVISIPEGELPEFKKMQDFSKWIKDILQEGGNITIDSTGQTASFTTNNIKASVKRSRSQSHRNSYRALREMIENSEYDHSEPKDERHPHVDGQDVYYSALRIGDKLFSVKIKLDVVPEEIKEESKKYKIDTGDVRYKDHKLTDIEITPALYAGLSPDNTGSFRQTADATKVSLGILRGNVNPTRIEDGVLYQSQRAGLHEDFSPKTDLIESAKETFGVTDDIREAGYVLPDGTMLDFSGRHWGLDDSEARGQRQVDHIDISEAEGIEDVTGNEMYDFMAQTGAMRVSIVDGNNVASIARPPTAQQLAALGRATNRKYLALSFNTPDGRIVSDTEFSSSSLGKIEEFLDEAQKKYERGEISKTYAQDVRGIYTPGERVITLLNSADESTFMHESGHYFLDVMEDIAGRKDCPQSIKDDLQTVFDWFGVKDLDEWKSMSLEERRQYHEQFARGFEQYLREGKAPSSQLKKVFKAFKDWLTKIYKSAKDLDVELSPEVRSVYDRLLATDEQIRQRNAEAQTPRNVQPEQTPLARLATQTVDNLPIPDETKTAIKEAVGIDEPAPTGDRHPHAGILTDEELVNQGLESNAVRDPEAFITDENGNDISIKDYLAEQDRIAEREIRDANAMGEAAQCMLRQGAFDDF